MKVRVYPFNVSEIIDCNCGANFMMSGSNMRFYSIKYGSYIILFDLDDNETKIYGIRKYVHLRYPVSIIDGILPYKELINKLKRLKAFV